MSVHSTPQVIEATIIFVSEDVTSVSILQSYHFYIGVGLHVWQSSLDSTHKCYEDGNTLPNDPSGTQGGAKVVSLGFECPERQGTSTLSFVRAQGQGVFVLFLFWRHLFGFSFRHLHFFGPLCCHSRLSSSGFICRQLEQVSNLLCGRKIDRVQVS